MYQGVYRRSITKCVGKNLIFSLYWGCGWGFISTMITQLIIINTVLWTKLFCNRRLFYNCPFADLHLPAVKRYYFQCKVFVGLVWLASTHIFVSDNSWDKSPSWFWKTLKLLRQFQNFQKRFRAPKNAILSTHSMVALIPHCCK